MEANTITTFGFDIHYLELHYNTIKSICFVNYFPNGVCILKQRDDKLLTVSLLLLLRVAFLKDFSKYWSMSSPNRSVQYFSK